MIIVPKIAPMKVIKRPIFGIIIAIKKIISTIVVLTIKNLVHQRQPLGASSWGCSILERAGSPSSPPGVAYSSSLGGSEHRPLYQFEVSITWLIGWMTSTNEPQVVMMKKILAAIAHGF